MNVTKKIDILHHALEYIIDAHGVAIAKCDDTLGMYYHDDAQSETVQDIETLITELNYMIISLRLQETEEDGEN